MAAAEINSGLSPRKTFAGRWTAGPKAEGLVRLHARGPGSNGGVLRLFCKEKPK